ncbi:MAG: hypothetical protein WA966_09420 [Ornithinimicrobium sp.]
MADATPEVMQDADGPVEPQLWHQYGMSSSISKAWLDPELTSAQAKTFDDAWDVLVDREEWRAWVREYLIPPSPFLVLLIRPGLDARRLRKTKKGVSMHLPPTEVHNADRSGDLIALYLDVIHAIYSKWAQVSACPPPPPVTN